MAALRLFTRSRPLMIIIQDSGQLKSFNDTLPNILQVHKRWGSYKTSPTYKDSEKYTDYEVTKDPQEWKYVESVLKPRIIPVPCFENKVYPSGWKPPVSNPGDHPYYIPRTKNYMQPLYLEITYRGTRRVTTIRRIQGDIWKLKSELTKYLHENTNKPVGVRVNELIGEIRFRGDYVTLLKNWLDAKGF